MPPIHLSWRCSRMNETSIKDISSTSSPWSFIPFNTNDSLAGWNSNGSLYLANNNDNDFIRFKSSHSLCSSTSTRDISAPNNVFALTTVWLSFVRRKTFMFAALRDGWMKCLSSNLFYLFFPPIRRWDRPRWSNTMCLVLLRTSLCASEMSRLPRKKRWNEITNLFPHSFAFLVADIFAAL